MWPEPERNCSWEKKLTGECGGSEGGAAPCQADVDTPKRDRGFLGSRWGFRPSAGTLGSFSVSWRSVDPWLQFCRAVRYFRVADHKLRTQSKGTTGSRTSSRFARFIHASLRGL